MKKNLTPLKAIRAKCLECSGHHPKEVRFCTNTDCPLYFFRLGTNPNRRGVGPATVNFASKSGVESANFSKGEVLND